MPLDLLDLTFRLEKEFALSLHAGWQENLSGSMARSDVTAGELHERVCHILHVSGREVPHSSWHRVQRCIARSMGVPVRVVKRSSPVRQSAAVGE